MQVALACDTPYRAKRSAQSEDVIKRRETELHRAHQTLAKELPCKDCLGHPPEDPRPRRARRDGENDRPDLEVFPPGATSVEVEIPADLPGENPRAFCREIDLDERVEDPFRGRVHEVRVRHDKLRAEPLKGLPVALPVEELVPRVGPRRVAEGERDL